LETGSDKLGRPVEVVGCCVDLEKFRAVGSDTRTRKRQELGIGDRLVVAYVGSFGGFYMTKETADFYGVAKEREPSAFALILTQSPPEMIRPLLEERGYTEDDLFIKKVRPNEIPEFLSAADIAVSFIKPSYSKLASSPTKNAEYLASGLAIIANSNVGDTAEMIGEDNTGVVIEGFDRGELESAFEQAVAMLDDREGLAKRCKASAKKRFDLGTVGGKRYRRIYSNLAESIRS